MFVVIYSLLTIMLQLLKNIWNEKTQTALRIGILTQNSSGAMAMPRRANLLYARKNMMEAQYVHTLFHPSTALFQLIISTTT